MYTGAKAAADDPVIRKRLEDQGMIVVGGTPDQLAAFHKADLDKWGPVIREAGLKSSESRSCDHGSRLPPHRTVSARASRPRSSILQRGDLSLNEMKGAYAGEIGQTQFLPSNSSQVCRGL